MGKETRNRQLIAGWGRSRRRGMEEELKRDDRVCSDTEETGEDQRERKACNSSSEGAVLTVSLSGGGGTLTSPNLETGKVHAVSPSGGLFRTQLRVCACASTHTYVPACGWLCVQVYTCAYLYIKAYMLIYTPLQITQRKQTAVYSCGLGHRCSSDSIPCLGTSTCHRYS